jgi:hypothetical protein
MVTPGIKWIFSVVISCSVNKSRMVNCNLIKPTEHVARRVQNNAVVLNYKICEGNRNLKLCLARKCTNKLQSSPTCRCSVSWGWSATGRTNLLPPFTDADLSVTKMTVFQVQNF